MTNSRPSFLNLGKTEDLKVLLGNPFKYVEGSILKIHSVGTHYTILEYQPFNPDGPPVLFSVYVDKLPIYRYSITFDAALLFAISYKNRQETVNVSAVAQMLSVPL